MNDLTGVTPHQLETAGPWRRLFAFLVDGLVLGAVGTCMGPIAFDRLMALGEWGRLVGLAIALIYFGAMDSKLFGGQTPGKRLLNIKVVTADSAPLGIGASTLRAVIFCAPYFLNGAAFNAGRVVS